MKRKSKIIFSKFCIKLGALMFVALGLVLILEMAFRPMVETVNAYRCHELLMDIINESVENELENEQTSYSSLVTLTSNADGEVVSVESNVMNINRLKTRIADRIEREIDRVSAVDINVPIGSLTGIQLFYGKGFDVGMKIVPMGYANTAIISEFSEAGINQTLHRIIIEVSAEVDAIIPGVSTRVPVKTSIVAAETVIVGRVPQAYTHVVTDSGDLAGLINDYGAINP